LVFYTFLNYPEGLLDLGIPSGWVRYNPVFIHWFRHGWRI